MYGKSKGSHTTEWVNTAALTAYIFTYIYIYNTITKIYIALPPRPAVEKK